MRLGRARLGWALALPLAVSGCIVEVEGIDPVGSDASLEGGWTIGGAPASAAACEANGITHVRVRVFDGADYADPASLVFDCADGAFDTRPNDVLRDGIWTLQLLAVDANAPAGEVVVDEGPMMSFDTLVEGGHIVIPTVDFMGEPTGTGLEGSWTIDGEPPTEARCADIGIDEVLVEITSGPGGARTLKYMCADGVFSEAVDPGDYEIRIVASNLDTGELPETEITESFSLGAGDTYIVNGGSPIDYQSGFSPLGSDAIFDAAWDIGGIIADEDVCDAVGGAEVDLLFFPADDTGRETDGVVVEMGAPCGPGVYDSGSPILAAGDYLVTAELYDATDNLISAVDLLDPVTVTAGSPLSLTFDFRLDSSTLHALLRYDDPISGTPGTCTEPTPDGVGMVTWEVFAGDRATGTLVADSGGDVACVDFVNVMSGVGGGALDPGTYELYFEGALPDTPAAKRWAGSCFLTIDDVGGLGFAICTADYMT
ncbi:MAG TPA: hypothetical protein RMH99_17230 [Sandaracinaceae bacterium LLY-WYZ-13_1]|nr:hypothetical protein [Sandaracinaceae bacterium LLY-WYZ-13_1]